MTQNENEMMKSNHSYGDVIKAVDQLPENNKQLLLSKMSIPQLVELLNSAEKFDEYRTTVETYINVMVFIVNTVSELHTIINTPVDSVDNILADYEKLNERQKKETTLSLLNNDVFQKDVCDILVKDMKRVISGDPTLKFWDDLLGISNYFSRCIEINIGTNHKYEVEL